MTNEPRKKTAARRPAKAETKANTSAKAKAPPTAKAKPTTSTTAKAKPTTSTTAKAKPTTSTTAKAKRTTGATATPSAGATARAKGRARPSPAPKPARARTKALVSASGYRVAAELGGARERLTVVAPDGRLVLEMRLLPDGPTVEVHARALRLAAASELRLECEDLAIEARRDVSLRAGGVIDSEAHAQRLRARLGDVEVIANDDVMLDGERVRLNSPRSAPPALAAGAATAPAPDGVRLVSTLFPAQPSD